MLVKDERLDSCSAVIELRRSESWSSDVDGVRGGGPESEGGIDDVEEAQGWRKDEVKRELRWVNAEI